MAHSYHINYVCTYNEPGMQHWKSPNQSAPIIINFCIHYYWADIYAIAVTSHFYSHAYSQVLHDSRIPATLQAQ